MFLTIFTVYNIVITKLLNCWKLFRYQTHKDGRVPFDSTQVAGVNRLQNKLSSLSIYPNPANDIICINSNDNSFNIDDLEVMLFDIVGNLVQVRTTLFSNEFKLNISDLSEGIYLMKINNSKAIKTETIVIRHCFDYCKSADCTVISLLSPFGFTIVIFKRIHLFQQKKTNINMKNSALIIL